MPKVKNYTAEWYGDGTKHSACHAHMERENINWEKFLLLSEYLNMKVPAPEDSDKESNEYFFDYVLHLD